MATRWCMHGVYAVDGLGLKALLVLRDPIPSCNLEIEDTDRISYYRLLTPELDLTIQHPRR